MSRRTAGAVVLFTFAWLVAGAASAFAASSVEYTPSREGSTLLVLGEADDDLVSFSVEGNTVTIRDEGTGGIATADADCANVGGAVTCPLDAGNPVPPEGPQSPVLIAGASLLDGNDTFSSTAPFTVGVNGGPGDDVITGGPREDELFGGLGTDTLLGGGGDDFLFSSGGGAYTTGGADVLDGQGGVDTAEYARQLGVNVTLNGQPDDGFPGEGDNAIVESVLGGFADDVITGSAEPNRISGQAGDDLISGLEGSDHLIGGTGDDGLDGGPQRDELDCAENMDTAILDPRDAFAPDCERTGAEPSAATARVSRRFRATVEVICPAAEANPCDGRLAIMAGQTQLGSGGFSVGPGLSGPAEVRLGKAGRKLLAKAGGTLLADAEARTIEPIGTSVKRADVLLLRRR